MVGILVRRASTKDAADLAKVRVESGHAAYLGIVPDSLLIAMNVEEDEVRWRRQLRRKVTELRPTSDIRIAFAAQSTPARP